MVPHLGAVTDQDFDRVVEQAAVPVLIAFWKPGCGHCLALMKELELLRAETRESLVILTMNVEENYQIPAELEVMSLPALALYHKGAFVRFIGGVGKREEILKQLEPASNGGFSSEVP